MHFQVCEGEAYLAPCASRTRSILNIILSTLPASVMASTALSIQTGHAASSGFEGSHHPDGGREPNLIGQWRTHAAMRASTSLPLRPRSWPEKGPKGPRHSQTPSGEGTEAKGRRGRKPSGFFQFTERARLIRVTIVLPSLAYRRAVPKKRRQTPLYPFPEPLT